MTKKTTLKINEKKEVDKKLLGKSIAPPVRISTINIRLIDGFLKANEAIKIAEATKKHFASKIIPEMKNLSLKSVVHKDFNITLCKKDTLEFGADIKALAEELKKQQEHAKLDGKFTITNTTEYLISTERKEPTKPKELKPSKKIA